MRANQPDEAIRHVLSSLKAFERRSAESLAAPSLRRDGLRALRTEIDDTLEIVKVIGIEASGGGAASPLLEDLSDLLARLRAQRNEIVLRLKTP